MPRTINKQLIEIDAPTLKAQIDRGDVCLVDVREPGEYAGAHIPGAHLASLSKFDPKRLPQVPGQKLVLYCQSGNRSAQAGRQLLDAGWSTVSHLQGGLLAWQEAGYDTEQSAHAPIDLQRQVQVTAGSLVLLGTLLGAFVSPWFLLLSGFIGVGFMVAGITGTCGMAMMLAKLPYNQRVSI